MKCTSCGAEIVENSLFCSGCGQPVQVAEQPNVPSPTTQNTAADCVFRALREPLFLVITILITASCVLSLFSGSGVSIISLLAAIFLWLVYSQKDSQILDPRHMRKVSGVVYAVYVINYIVAALYIVIGGALIPASALLNESYNIIKDYIDSSNLAIIEELVDTLGISLSLIFMIVGIILLVAGILMIVFNIVGYRRIHQFVKSTYQSVYYGRVGFVQCRAAQTWLVVYAVFSLISALTSGINIFTAVCSLTQAIAMILGSVLIRKYFVPFECQE